MAEMITGGGLEFYAENREGGQDGGPSLQVWGGADNSRVQLLRFDMFRVQPHYHYAPMGRNLRYDLDPLLLDDGIGWTIGQLKTKLAPMLAKAGDEGSIRNVDTAAVAAILPEVERKWRATAQPR